jgi:hypothetical protein
MTAPLQIAYTYVAQDAYRGTFHITVSGIGDNEEVHFAYGDSRGSYNLSNVHEIGKPSFGIHCEVYRAKEAFAEFPVVRASLGIQQLPDRTYTFRGNLLLDLRDGSLTFTEASLQDREVEIEFVPLPSGR